MTRLYGIFAALSMEEALRLWDLFLDDYREPAPDPVLLTEMAVPEGLAMKMV